MKGALITFIACLLLYSFVLKPQIVHKLCEFDANNVAVLTYPLSDYPDINERSALQNKLYQNHYDLCVGLH